MQRFDFYFEQLVTQADMDEVFDFVEAATQQLQSDNDYVGIVQGQAVSEAFPTPDLTVDISVGVAYDADGQRVFIDSAQNLDLSVDSNSVSTAVAGGGNEKWLAVFVEFDRALSEPRVDGNGVPLQYRRAESYQFVVDQGAEAAAGSAAVYTSTLSEPFALVNGETLDISVGNTPAVTVTFLTADFAAIGAATAAEVAAVIQAVVPGVTAADDGGGAVEITTLGTGPSASVVATGGNTLAKFGFPQSAAVGAGGPTRPALRPDAVLLADVLLRQGTTQIFDAPDAGPSDGVIDVSTRRQTVFAFQGQHFKINAGTITEFADALIAEVDIHIANTGNAHPASAITVDSSPLPALWADLKVAPEVQQALLAVTTDLGAQTGTVGSDLVGTGAAGPDLTAASSLSFALATLDSTKGSKGNANTWTATNTFSGAIVSNGAVDLNTGARIDVDLLVNGGVFRQWPQDWDAANWAFDGLVGGIEATIRHYGHAEQYTLTAGASANNIKIFDGSAAPATTVCGMVEGRVMAWDNNSNPVAASMYTFRSLFSLSAGAGQTVDSDAQLETVMTVGGGATNLTGVSVFEGAANGELYLQTSWGANAGSLRDIVVEWKVTIFQSNQ